MFERVLLVVEKAAVGRRPFEPADRIAFVRRLLWPMPVNDPQHEQHELQIDDRQLAGVVLDARVHHLNEMTVQATVVHELHEIVEKLLRVTHDALVEMREAALDVDQQDLNVGRQRLVAFVQALEAALHGLEELRTNAVVLVQQVLRQAVDRLAGDRLQVDALQVHVHLLERVQLQLGVHLQVLVQQHLGCIVSQLRRLVQSNLTRLELGLRVVLAIQLLLVAFLLIFGLLLHRGQSVLGSIDSVRSIRFRSFDLRSSS